MKTASRNDWRDKKNQAKAFRSTYKVPVETIEIDPVWNIRTLFDGIAELALDIAKNGLLDPLSVDLNPDTCKYIVRDGERRFKAIMLLNQDGYNITEVEVRPAPGKDLTEKLFFMLGTGVNKSMYQPIEIANGILRIKESRPELSNLEIGMQMGMSRQWVDNMVKLAKKPEEVKEKVASGEAKYTDVIKKGPKEEMVSDMKESIVHFKSPDDGCFDGSAANHYIHDEVAQYKDPSLIDEMAGILPPDKNAYREPDTETDRLARKMAREERQESEGESLKDPDLEAIRKSVLNNLAKLESIGRGLPDEAQAEHDRILGYIRVSMQVDIFEAVKGKFKR
jgi:ParB/RepB/Spo0J family partition protein